MTELYRLTELHRGSRVPTEPADVKVRAAIGGGGLSHGGRPGVSCLAGFPFARSIIAGSILQGPAETAQDIQQGGIVRRHGWQILADPASLPPVSGAVVEAGELVFVELGSHEGGPFAGKRVLPQEAQRAGVGEEEFVDQVDQPGLMTVVGHGGEPDLPVHSQVIG